MLPSLRSIGRILRPLQPVHARFVTVLPKATPEYTPRWDPTNRIPQQPGPAIARDAARDDARRGERAQLCHTLRDVAVLPRDGEVFAPRVRHYTLRLNNLLRQAEWTEDYPSLHWMLRETCLQLRETSPETFAQTVPDQAWDMLWRIQEKASKRKHNVSPPHLKGLWDGLDLGIDYEPLGHRIHYLTQLFSANKELALTEWEQDRLGTNTLPRHDYKPEHLELGVTMYALYGNPIRAHQIMEELFELHPTWSPSVAKTVFRAYTASEADGHQDKAKLMYKEYKQKMGDNMSLEDYDAFFYGFLESRNMMSAKLTFRDMVKGKRLATSLDTEEVEKVLSRLHMLCKLGTDSSKMTMIGLQAISVLPQAYHHHVYAHWLKFTKIKHSPEIAAQVLEMMFERGAQPQTVHFNLLLKAFMKVQQTQYVSKGEAIGWRMIEETQKASVQSLPREKASQIISQWKESKPTTATEETPRDVAQANVTTFAVLIRHHSIRWQWEHVDYLERKFKDTGFQPNAELLDSLMDAKCRQGKYGEVWLLYKSFTDVPEGAKGVFPNGSTMRLLWKSLRLAHKIRESQRDPDLPRPRELLAETVQWWERCRARPDVERFRIGLAGEDLGALSSLVVHCFSAPRDLAGSLVAQHVLRKYFGLFPTAKTVKQFVRQAGWTSRDSLATRGERWRFHNLQGGGETEASLVQRSSHIYGQVSSRRKKRLKEQGIDPADVSEEEKIEHRLSDLSGFVRALLRSSQGPDVAEAILEKAKADMGVPDMTID